MSRLVHLLPVQVSTADRRGEKRGKKERERERSEREEGSLL